MSRHEKGERLPVPGAAREMHQNATHRGRVRQCPREPAVMVALAAIVFSLATVSAILNVFGSSERPPTAAIIDQLSLTQPNPDFVETAAQTLLQAGYSVDYYGGGAVTVDFYRNLPMREYDLIVLRAHSGVIAETGSVGLFTSESYSPARYTAEQKASRFGRARYYEGGDVYFGILPEFVAGSMRGTFDRALVIMMGCWGLANSELASAFVQRGAVAVVSWDGPVSAQHTDDATEHLLQHLSEDRLTVADAVAQTMDEVGQDPTYGSSLLFYPPESVDSGLGQAYLAP